MHTPHPPSDASVAWCAQVAERLLQCSQLMRCGLHDALKPYDLRDVHFLLLWRCGRDGAGGVAQLELAATLAVSPAQISALVEQLRSRDLLAPHRPADDRRRQHWRLTDSGRALLDELDDRLQPWVEQLRSNIAESRHPDPMASLWPLLDGLSVESRPFDSVGIERRKRGAA